MTGAAVIGRMRGAESDAERAAALLEAPLAVLLVHGDCLARLCRRAAFDEGADYLDAVAEMMARPRHRGTLGTMRLTGAATTLLGVVDGVPRRRGSTPCG